MKSVFRFVVLILIVSLNSAYSFPGGERISGHIKAVIIDASTNSPVEYANVTLHNAKDSSYVTGSASGKGGELLIPNVPAGEYFVKVTFIGYDKAIVQHVIVSSEKKDVSLGEIKIYPSEVKMADVSVVGEKPAEEYHIDKRVINVAQDNSSAGGTALDVLQNQPSVQIDQDGNVKLRGSGNFTVMVNGRPGVLQGSDALRQIPANIIENIELITNPSAKYDAEGSAGIINIVTKTIAEGSLSGIFNAGSGTRNKYNGDATINYRYGGWALSGGLDYRNYNSFNDQAFDRYTYLENETKRSLANINQNNLRESYSAKFGIDYTFNPNTSLSFSGTAGNMKIDRTFTLKAANENGGATNASDYTINRETGNIESKYFQSTVFFSNKFIPKVDELTFEATYTHVDLPTDQTDREYVTDQKFEQNIGQPVMREFKNGTIRNDGRLKLNYSYTISDNSKFETGLQANLAYRNFDVLNQNFDWDTEQWMVDNTYTNKFDFRNNVYSVFATYSNELFGIGYQLGLRAEETDRLLTQKTTSEKYEYDRVHLFPTLSALYKITDAQQLQLSYSRRINRPNEGNLNPYRYYSDSYATVVGNPALLPEITDALELNYQNTIGGVFLSVQTYYKYTNNSITQSASVESDGRLKLSFDNVAKSYTLGSEISTSISLAQWLKLDPAINLYGNGFEGMLFGESYSKDEFAWNSRMRATINFSKETRFQVNLMYNGRQSYLQGEIDPLFFLGMSLRHEFLDRSLIVTLNAQNLFGSGKFNITNTPAANNYMKINVRPEAPMFSINLSYNFNNFKNTSRVNDRVDVNVREGF